METSKSITHPMNTNSVATSDKMCPSLQALDILKDKWSIKVLVLLQNGPLRYMQIRRQAGGSTQKMLTQTLRKLEREGLITRTVYPTSPPTVEYALASLGEMLQEPLQGLLHWARIYTANQNDLEAESDA